MILFQMVIAIKLVPLEIIGRDAHNTNCFCQYTSLGGIFGENTSEKHRAGCKEHVNGT